MGSGKSYEVVTVVILGALKIGRRVVSNIAGLNYDEMCRVLIGQGVDENRLGSIVQVDHEKVTEKGFWLTDQESNTFIQPGDLVVLDEVWRFYDGFSQSVPENVMNFFRMHRHFTHPETGLTCDVALITQDINDLGRKIRPVVEETYYMEKLTALGSVKHYRVDVFAGARKYRDAPFRSIQRAYNPELYCLYQSHSQKSDAGADAQEVNIDDRGNIFKSKFFRVVVPLAVVVFLYSVYTVVGFFRGDGVKKSPAATVPASASGLPASPVSSSPVSVPSLRSASSDPISRLLSSGRARLAFLGELDGRRLAKVDFSNGDAVEMYSEDELFVLGWRLFFSSDGRTAILSNGTEHHVISVEARHRLPQINRVQ
jgi:zona occludens toxin